MKFLGIRFCSVSKNAEELAKFLGDGLGLEAKKLQDLNSSQEFSGAVFPAGDSWIEVWKEGPGMPKGIMLQIVVDDADAWAKRAKENGLNPEGPIDEHGERIYYLQAPGGLPVSFQSKLE